MSELRSTDDILCAVESSRVPGRRLLVAIVGSPGAGKSTLAAELVARIPQAALLAMDGYHLPQRRLVELGRRVRMGAPDTFDVEAFLATLRALRAENSGDRVGIPGFDREIEEPVPNASVISPEFSTVVAEGNYLLLDSDGWAAAAPIFDLRLFLAVDPDVRQQRLIARHVRFGKTEVDARAWALGTDERNAELIEATAGRADHIVRLG